MALLHSGELVAVARAEDGWLRPTVVLETGDHSNLPLPRLPASALPNGTTVTVGSFDGVHLGHQAVLQEIERRARAAGRASVLVTFDPHPLEVVNPARRRRC